jgi:hypothetical protein
MDPAAGDGAIGAESAAGLDMEGDDDAGGGGAAAGVSAD